VRSIRIVTLNLWHTAGDPDRRLEVLMPQLLALQPQVVALQEVRQRRPGEGIGQAQQLAAALRADYRFAAVDGESEGGPVGNAILSRVPILSEKTLRLPTERPDDLRGALRCDLQTAGGRLPLVCCHLSWELDAAPVREQQAVLLDEWAKRDPGDIPTVMVGDFNCTPDSLVHQFLTGRASLLGRGTYWRDAYQRRHSRSDGYTWSARNPYVVRNVERNRRIDYIFVGPMQDHGPGAILHSRVVLDLPNADEVYPSDHFGVFAEIALVPVASGV
jgi:endonuclease/exonuclease/phosphatase family metal-dependent hydrolase